GITSIVCLMPWSELDMLGLRTYPAYVGSRNIDFYHLPVKDRGIPHIKDALVFVLKIISDLSMNRKVLVHCRSGFGRSGTICACCLIHYGVKPIQAIHAVRSKR